MTSSAPPKARMVVGITGASGIVLAIRLLETLRRLDIESHLVMSRAAKMTLRYETDLKAADIHALADVVHAIGDVGAPISSGSFRTLGMIVVPCSMKTLAEVATGVTGTLLSRAADVTLKERRRLVLIPRETPLHAMHLRNMLTVTEMGGVIAPPVPAFYNRPESLDDVVDHLVARALDLFGLDAQLMQRWGEDE